MDLRFLCDRNLGKLEKWLRIIGYDTIRDQGTVDQEFLEKAGREGRIVLTRKRSLAVGYSGRLIVVKNDRVGEQICEVMDALAIKPDFKDRMTLCLRCNARLEAVTEVELQATVPEYIYQKEYYFRKCPICKRIYWPGTHVGNIEETLRMRIPTHRP